MVGRESHRLYLEQALSGAREGRGGCLFLVGEVGIGKSRLVAEAVDMASDSEMRVLRGRSSATGPAVPFRPLAEALMSLFRSGEAVGSSALGPYQSALGRLVPDWDTGDCRAAGRESSSTVILGEALLRLFMAAAKDRGLVLVLEDLHDADSETLAVVEYMVDNLEHMPVLLLVTIGTEISDVLELADSARRRRTANVIELSPLTRPQVRDMAAALLDVEPCQLPQAVVDRLWDVSAGNPSIAEELLQSMVNCGLLVQGDNGWRVLGDLGSFTPTSLFRGVLRRVDRLGPKSLVLLSAAALLGRRFPLTVLQRMTGITSPDLLSHLHAGIAARLIVSDQPVPDWYAFRHSLTVDALLSQLTPGQRSEMARRAADAVEALHPELPNEWCPFMGQMRAEAGDFTEAGRLFLEAGRRDLAAGSIGSAAVLLARAEQALADTTDINTRAEAQELLLSALTEAGDFARAFDLAEHLHTLGGTNTSTIRLAALHTQVAKLAHTAGRWADGNRHIARARTLLHSEPDNATLAAIDITAAHLVLDTPGTNRAKQAETLARAALEAAERHDLPTIACQALEVLAVVGFQYDPGQAYAMLEQAHALAERHHLPLRRMYAATRIGAENWLTEGDTTELHTARQDALRLGSAVNVQAVDGILVLDSVLRGQFEAGQTAADRCLAAVRCLSALWQTGSRSR
ncbi:AAA family ATPase [Streptomyces sp. NPDC050549]|uniref:ATP-binding protein n=1 Tax=Streptomyces sp. NPDC050549 TaxID=3155406 RepID=UPI00343628EE